MQSYKYISKDKVKRSTLNNKATKQQNGDRYKDARTDGRTDSQLHIQNKWV